MKIKTKYEKYINSILVPTLSIIFSLILGGIFIFIAGYDPIKAFAALFGASFGSIRTFGQCLVKTSPLIFTGVAVSFTLRCKVFNIGAEGQFLMGAVMATWVGVTFTDLPPFLLIPFTLFCGAIGGGLCALIPGYLKAKHGISEVITTLMFNSIAIRLIGFLIKGPLKEAGYPMPQSARISENAFLPLILPGTKLHLGFLIAVSFAVIIYIILFKTYFGYEIRAVGFNTLAAENGGIDVKKNIILTMIISGAISGVGGAVEITGVAYRLFDGLSPGYGYTAIAVAILANKNPLGVILTAFVFGILNTGGTAMQRTAGVSPVVILVFQGIIIFFLALSTALSQKKLKVKRSTTTRIAGDKLITREKETRNNG